VDRMILDNILMAMLSMVLILDSEDPVIQDSISMVLVLFVL
jgi:hypothetical protein